MKFTILESILDAFKSCGEIYYIYVNPTKQELNSKEDSKGNRGVIDVNGDLYVEAAWSDDPDNFPLWSDWIHDDLLENLHSKGKCSGLVENRWHADLESPAHGVCVHRDKSSLDFYIAESYDDLVIMNNWPEIESIFELAKKKNPHLNFKKGYIYTVGEE